MTSTMKSSRTETVTTQPNPSIDVLLAEYESVGQNWRFFIGLRASTFSAFITINSTLAAVTGWILSSRIDINKARIISVIALISIVSTIAVALTEYRLERLFHACLLRALELEELLSLGGGQYHQIRQMEVSNKSRPTIITYTRIMMFILLLTLLMWMTILLFSERVVKGTMPVEERPSASPVQK
jgi:hypothetical protein